MENNQKKFLGIACKFIPKEKIGTMGGEYISGDKIIIKDGDVYFLPPA